MQQDRERVRKVFYANNHILAPYQQEATDSLKISCELIKTVNKSIISILTRE